MPEYHSQTHCSWAAGYPRNHSRPVEISDVWTWKLGDPSNYPGLTHIGPSSVHLGNWGFQLLGFDFWHVISIILFEDVIKILSYNL